MGDHAKLFTSAPHLVESFNRYIDNRIEPGGFLRACLENDFIGAACRADLENRHRLFDIAEYIYNYLPVGSYGSKELVSQWLSGE